MPDPLEELAPFGTDRIASRASGEIVLRCLRPKGWNPRRVGAQTRAAHPGTAVSWGDRLFEVVSTDTLADGAVTYRLAPWPEAQAIRTLEPYDEASESARAAARAEQGRDLRSRLASILLAPLAGLLPGEIQTRMEREFGAPARAMTISSALLTFAVGFVGGVFALAEMAGAISQSGGAPWFARLSLPLCLYLVVESAVRLASGFVMDRPMGTLAAELPYRLWCPAQELRAEPPASSSGRDRYLMLEAVLALLSPAEQIRLRKEFDFDPILWGKRTAWLLGVVGGANAAVAVLNAASGAASFADLVWLLAGGALAAEQVARLRLLRDGRPAGSVLGVLVRPLARPLLRLPASPS